MNNQKPVNETHCERQDQEKIFEYWNGFYARQSKRTPSQFAALVASELREPCVIIDVGCGNGRDSVFLSDNGHVSIGLDASKTVTEANNDFVKNNQKERAFFHEFAIGRDTLKSVLTDKNLTAFANLPVVIYSRFFLHAINEALEDLFLEDIFDHANKIDHVYFEYRETRDENIDKVYDDHYRRFIDADVIADKIQNSRKFQCDYQFVGQGLAKFRDEDPWIARQIFSRKTF